MSQEKEGWGLPALSRKWHYFRGKWALCRKWLFGGPLEQGKDDSPENCADCRRRLLKEREKEAT